MVIAGGGLGDNTARNVVVIVDAILAELEKTK